MHYLILSVLFLFLVYAALRAFLNANPKDLAKTLRKIGGAAMLVLATFFAVTGRFAVAAPLAFFGLTLLGRSFATGGFNPFGGNANKSEGQRSRVRTATVEMELDHDSGHMDGTVMAGEFAGRRLSAMDLHELETLLDSCNSSDAQAAQLVEAYLDRTFPDWRDGDEGQRGSRSRQDAPGDGRMSVEEALEILGLEPNATRAEIRRAHRSLMKRLHPDHGGSTYLAAKINQAKDLLLGEGGEAA